LRTIAGIESSNQFRMPRRVTLVMLAQTLGYDAARLFRGLPPAPMTRKEKRDSNGTNK
jgi:hypothetical protein